MQLKEDLLKKGGVFEIARFVIVGGMATAVDLFVTVLLVYVMDMGQSENIVTTVAFCTALLVSYFGHRFFTFHKKGSIVKFLGLALSTLALRNCIVLLLTAYVVRGIVALIAAMAIVTVITYVVSKFGIFKDDGSQDAHSVGS